MLYGWHQGGLELRRAGDGTTRLRGRFPYGKKAVLSDGGRTGRPRKETFAPNAFAFRVNRPEKNIHLLTGHDYGKPLAARLADTLDLTDTAEALTFEATITRELAEVSWVRDTLAALSAGLFIGLSPGFRIPPERAVKDAETVEQEPEDPDNDMHGAIIRTIHAALLYELSVVTRPAYTESEVEARNWNLTPETPDAGLRRTLGRWRP